MNGNYLYIAENIDKLKKRIRDACIRVGRSADEITIVAVTKGASHEAITMAYQRGIRHFGENRVQEAWQKLNYLSDIRGNITWHMIGHLQTNKINKALQLFDIFESVDSIRLADTLNSRVNHKIPILIQVNISAESTKSGFHPDEIARSYSIIAEMNYMDIKGLMAIAPVCKNPGDIIPYFRGLRRIADELGVKELSMGMTDDFEVAIEEGATIIRIGRAIFAERGL